MEENQEQVQTQTQSNDKKSMNWMPMMVMAIILAVGGWMLLSKKPSAETADLVKGDNIETVEPTAAVVQSQVIEVEGGEFYFKPNEIRVKKGQEVTLVLNNVNGFHDLVIDELNVRTKQIQGGQSERVTFTPTEAGSFEYYCSVGKHRQMGMKGTLVVE